MPYIPIILGTARVGRQSEHVANFILEKIQQAGYDTEIIDVRDYPQTHTQKGASTPELKTISEKITAAAALIIVVPEYNHGYPGELKIFIDTFSDEYIGKPIAFVGAGGLLGGGRAIEQLRQVVVELGAYSLKTALYFPMVWTLFENGKLKDEAAYDSRVSTFLEDIAQNIT